MEAYKDRFINEFNQLVVRINKLERIIMSAKENTLDFNLSCPIDLLEKQLAIMKDYRAILLQRATIEDIKIGGYHGL